MALRLAKQKYGETWTTMTKDERKAALADLHAEKKQDFAGNAAFEDLSPAQQKIMKMLNKVVNREITKMKKESIYSSKEYWDQRHAEDESTQTLSNEWFLGYDLLRNCIRRSVPQSQHVLVLGCGLSNLEDDMWEDGYGSLVAVDYSPSCVAKRKQRHTDAQASVASAQRGTLAFEEQDIRSMTYASCSFDVVLDKATLDTMYNIEIEGDSSVDRMLQETLRVLRPGGKYVVVSHGAPHERVDALASVSSQWSLIGFEEIKRNTRTFYVYILQKDQQPISCSAGMRIDEKVLANLQQRVAVLLKCNAQLKIQLCQPDGLCRSEE